MPDAKGISYFIDTRKREVHESEFDVYYPESMNKNCVIGGAQVQHMYFPRSLKRVSKYTHALNYCYFTPSYRDSLFGLLVYASTDVGKCNNI
jgi:hypothetical protein